MWLAFEPASSHLIIQILIQGLIGFVKPAGQDCRSNCHAFDLGGKRNPKQGNVAI